MITATEMTDKVFTYDEVKSISKIIFDMCRHHAEKGRDFDSVNVDCATHYAITKCEEEKLNSRPT
jgi:hypothetical protein